MPLPHAATMAKEPANDAPTAHGSLAQGGFTINTRKSALLFEFPPTFAASKRSHVTTKPQRTRQDASKHAMPQQCIYRLALATRSISSFFLMA